MTSWVLLPDLIKHFRDCSKKSGLDLAEFEVEEVLASWLEKIQTPTTMRGLGRIMNTLHRWSHSAEVKKRLKEIFELPEWFFPALDYSITFTVRKHEAIFLELKMGSGWCENAPFYAWLFRASQYNNHTMARSAQLLFMEQYFKKLDNLNTSELSTNLNPREQEECSAARLLFDANNPDFKDLVAHLTDEALSSPRELAELIEMHCNNSVQIERKNNNYFRILVHFFRQNWGEKRQRQQVSRFNSMISRRYNQTKKSMVQGSDASLQEILPYLPDELDNEGVESDDDFPQQIFVEINGDFASARDPKEIPAVERIFDPVLLRKRSIDVTNKVRRGQNVSLQNTELLKAGDLARLIRFLQKPVSHENQIMAMAFWTMLLTGKDSDEIAVFILFDDLKRVDTGLYLDPEGNGWWSFPVTYSAKPRLDGANRGLNVPSHHAFTACPSFFVQLIRKHYQGGAKLLFPDGLFTSKLAKRLKKFSDHLPSGHRINLEKISSFIERFCFATNSIDPVVLDFSYQLALSRTRVSRSYACLDDELRVSALQTLWTDITQFVRSADPSLECPVLFEVRHWHQPQQVGSTFTPSQDACRELVSHLRKLLTERTPSVTFPLSEILHYHNAYAAYTAYLLMFATGYRAVHNPLPSLALHLRAYRLLGISDKDDSDFTHARIVCMPELLERQLGYYTQHLGMLAELLRCREPMLAATVDGLLKVDEELLSLGFSEASHWYKTVRNSRRELGPLFHFSWDEPRWQALNLSPKALSAFMPAHLTLPTNAGRHWLKSQLIKRNVDPELIDWQMGHWMTGQAPLGYYSTLSHVEVSQMLSPILDELLKEVGWQPLPSRLI